MIDLTQHRTPADLAPLFAPFWEASAAKIRATEAHFDPDDGAPVFTVAGRYSTRGWTEWTQGFQYGAMLLHFDATGDADFLELGRQKTLDRMAPHVTHTGVHDHGFNNVSTYGALRRLMNEGRIEERAWERHFYEMALKASGAVQADRWADIANGEGFVYSFNGPQSLFSDTIRSMRSLAIAHSLGHTLGGEGDVHHSLLGRLIAHAHATAKYNVYYGEGRDGYDIRGRVVHESIFNRADGNYRCPSTQQGYTPFTTWTRGLAWVMCGYPEQLEYIATLDDATLEPFGGRAEIEAMMLKAARAACDFYIAHTPTCGVPYWDTGAPTLHELGAYLDRPAEPYNDHEPVDSSAAAIACQGLVRLGEVLAARGQDGSRYTQAGLKTLETLLGDPYLSTDPDHDGLLLHSVYHWPNRWDYVPEGQQIACGEATMWGDYHLREAVVYVQRMAEEGPTYRFFG